VALHWATLLALLAGVSMAWVRDAVDGRVLRSWLLEGHTHIGLLVLALWAARVALRLKLGKLPVAGNPSIMLRVVAGLTHAGLYVLLFALPLLGWAASNAHGKTVDLLGLPLPMLVAPDEDIGDELLAWHVTAAWALLALGVMHASAALWHHFVLRDSLLMAMLPRRRP
jgi:cytochrome b561